MYLFDNTSASSVRIARDHFRLKVGSDTVVFCRVRKNASSAIRRLFAAKSPYAQGPRDGPTFRLMEKHHRVWVKWLLPADGKAVFIYRDPVARITSIFANKFQQRRGAHDILRHFEEVTGSSGKDVTLDEFVFQYVSRVGRAQVDPHLRPQADHLAGLRYHALPLRQLSAAMPTILGEEVAHGFFSEKKNQSPSEQLTPGAAAEEVIRRIYARDYSLIERIEASPPIQL